MYTIYHIPEVKVGCTSRDPQVRVEEQGYTQFEVVEVVSSKEEASIRERYWQERLGYQVDDSTYLRTLKAVKKNNTSEAKAKRIKTRTASVKYQTGREVAYKKMRKLILQYDRQGNFIKEWQGVGEISRYFKCEPGNITSNLRGRSKTAKGYIWKYK